MQDLQKSLDESISKLDLSGAEGKTSFRLYSFINQSWGEVTIRLKTNKKIATICILKS